MLTRIKSAVITSIALCKRGKNGMRTLLKADGSVEFSTLVKAAGENELLTVVYAPERPDDDGDVADAPVIKSMAHTYLRDHRALDIEHDGKALPPEAAYVAESFIVAEGDKRFQNWLDYDNKPVGDLTGAWASVIKLEDHALQKAYRDGTLDGVSLFGKAAVEQDDPKAAAQRVADRLTKARLQETQMNEELKQALAAMKAELVTLVKSAVAELKPAEPKKEEPAKPALKAPEFEGDASNPEDLAKFEVALRGYELNKALSEGKLTAKEVAELRKSVSEGQPSDKDAGIESTDTPRERELKRELFKARKTRNAPERQGEGEPSEIELRKANEDEGRKIAELMNGQRVGGSSMQIVNK